jgi:hypothetical protein
MRSGHVTELPTSARRTAERGGSLLPTPRATDGSHGPDYAIADRPNSGGDSLVTAAAKLLPTPQARDGQRWGTTSAETAADRMDSGRRNLDDAVALLPTPTKTDGHGSRRETARTDEWDSHHGTTLTDAITLLPTPTASLVNDGESLESWEARRDRLLQEGYNGNGMGEPLTITAQRLLPTPTHRDYKDSPGQDVPDNALLGRVAQRFGGSSETENSSTTGQPSNGGSGSSDDQHQLPLWTDD